MRRAGWALGITLTTAGTVRAAEPTYRRYTDEQGVVHVTPVVRDAGARTVAAVGPELRGSGEGADSAAPRQFGPELPEPADRTSRPVGPEQTSRPVGPEQTSRPVGPGQTSRPIGPGQTSRPIGPDQASPPIGPDQTSPPIGPDQASRPDPRIAGRARDAAEEVAEALGDERSRRYEPWIRGAAKLYQLPESLVRAVVHTESNYHPNVVSSAGAMGLTQLMPSTARFLGVTRPFDPRQNIYGGAKFLRLLANRFGGDMVLVLAGYFSGAGAVQKYGGVPPHSGVRGYVKAVLRRFYAYERELQLREDEAAGPSRSIAVP